MRVKAAHVRLCASRAVYVQVYPRETQEMVFDAHARAFAFFGGVPTRGIYYNMKTAVDTVFTGKERVFNRRFLIMTDHDMIEPTACTPASGYALRYAEGSALRRQATANTDDEGPPIRRQYGVPIGRRLTARTKRGQQQVVGLQTSVLKMPVKHRQ